MLSLSMAHGPGQARQAAAANVSDGSGSPDKHTTPPTQPLHAGQWKTWQLAVSASLQLLCYTIAFSAAFIMILYQFVIVLPFWTWIDDPDNPWQKFRTDASFYKYKLSPGNKLFSGWDAMLLIWTFGLAGVATIAAPIPALLLSKRLRSAAWEWLPMDLVRRTYYKVERYGSYPVWPHRFWLWWSCGLNVTDALLWCLFLVAHLVGIQQMTVWYQRMWPAWDSAGLEYPIPKTVDNLRWISLACSWVLYLDFTIIFFPVTHISFLHTLLGSSWAQVIKYHRWIGHFGMWTLTAHGLAYYYYWLCNPYDNFWHEFWDWNTVSSINNIAGSLSWLFGVALWVTSVDWVRRNYFQVFYSVHILGFIGFIVFAQMHYYWSIFYMAPGIIVYLLDVAYRALQSQNVSQVTRVAMTPDGTLAKLDIPVDPKLAKSLHAGQEVFLQFPSFSRWAWHPFTIYKVNIPSEPGVLPSMTVLVKKYSRWTKKLMAELNNSIATAHSVPVKIVGPVGGLHGVRPTTCGIVMFVGGVGASPALALLNHMVETGRTVPTTLVYSARNMNEFTVLDETVLQAESSKWLTVNLYHTGSDTTQKVMPDLTDKRSNSIGSSGSGSDEMHSSSREPPQPSKPAAPVVGNAWISGPGVGPEGILQSNTATTGMSRTIQTWLSSYGWGKARPMQSRAISKWNMFVALLLMWLGGFMGMVQAQSAVIERWYVVWTNEDGWKLGSIYLLCVVVQGMGLPALYLFCVQFYQFFRSRASLYAEQHVATDMVPQCQILGHGKVGLPETQLSLDVSHGRPNIRAVLKEAVERCPGSGDNEVAVVLAGPIELCNRVEEAVWSLNRERASNEPFLRPVRETFQL